MSLNKFTDTSIGLDIGLEIGAKDVKCNTLEVVDLTVTGVINTPGGAAIGEFGTFSGNYVMSAGSTTGGTYSYFKAGDYFSFSDNVPITTPSAGDFFDITFDLPPFILLSSVEVSTLANGMLNTAGLSIAIMKTVTTINTTTKKMTIRMSKVNGNPFSSAQSFTLSYTSVIDIMSPS